ncbi:MAG TPA: hypothetical protein VGQ39_21695 [Pyrinomonadaceae bacterium]|jgi:hypothetical protein|nr:hypothetical protein [Pyrinomonadaceae bacterium]
MKKHTALVLAGFALLFIALASANPRMINIEACVAGTDEPKSVPGTINRGQGAIVKPGYTFVRRGDEVDVVRTRGSKTGTYVCSCRSRKANEKCELLFSPKQILCRQGSCSGGSCLLVPVEPAATQ